MQAMKKFESEIENQIDDLENKIKLCQEAEDWKTESLLIQAQNQLMRTKEVISD